MRKSIHGISLGFLALMGGRKRQKYTVPLFAICLSLLAGGVLVSVLGTHPLAAYQSLLQGSGLLPKANYAGSKSMLTDFASFLNAWTPMVFASLSVAVALRAGLLNIGVSGQMLLGGFVASITVGYSDLPALVAKPMVVLIAVLVGATTGALIGWLKHRFNINEVVSTIMTNYIAQYVISFFISNFFLNQTSRQSNAISPASRLTLMDYPLGSLKIEIPLGVILAFLVAFALQFLLEQTTLGFQLKAVGSSPSAARYGGISVGKNLVVAMMLSGGLAGLAGATYYLGLFGSIGPKVLAPTGFDAIAVSLLAGSSPVGILFSSFLITILSKGSTYMSSSTGLAAEIASVITGIILLFSACSVYLRVCLEKLEERLPQKADSQKGGED